MGYREITDDLPNVLQGGNLYVEWAFEMARRQSNWKGPGIVSFHLKPLRSRLVAARDLVASLRGLRRAGTPRRAHRSPFGPG